MSRDTESECVACLVALGSNLGDRLAHLRAGIAALQQRPGVRVCAISQLYETAPVGGLDNQGAYFNAAMLVETSLPAAGFLALLHQIEASRERERKVHWGARTLDLDLLTYGNAVAETDALKLPHPRMHERRFVMVPVCDIATNYTHPALGKSMGCLLAEIPAEPDDLRVIATNWAEAPIQGTVE